MLLFGEFETILTEKEIYREMEGDRNQAPNNLSQKRKALLRSNLQRVAELAKHL